MEGLRDDSSFLGPGAHPKLRWDTKVFTLIFMPPTLGAPEVSSVPRLAKERVSWEVAL